MAGACFAAYGRIREWVVLAGGVRQVPGLRRLARPSRLVGLLTLVPLVDFIVLSGVPGYNGLIEILFVAMLFGWPVFLATARRQS